jgi:hypothetical protein
MNDFMRLDSKDAGPNVIDARPMAGSAQQQPMKEKITYSCRRSILF